MTRPSFDEIAFQLTRTIAQRSTCPRLHTAAVIMTPDHRLVASGYNGSLPGLAHCEERVCSWCDGTGNEARSSGIPGVIGAMYRVCTKCNGTGKLPSECLIIDGHCVRTVHAEANAIAQAAKYGTSIEGCHIYILHQPCLVCTKLIVASGIIAVHYDQNYDVHDEESKIAIDMMLRSKVNLYTPNTVPRLATQV